MMGTTAEMPDVAPELRQLELLLPDIRSRKEAHTRQLDQELAAAIDAARDAGCTWDDIAEAMGGKGRQYAYTWRRRLPDPS